MPKQPKPDTIYNNDAWISLLFITEVWNRNSGEKPISVQEYYSALKKVIKENYRIGMDLNDFVLSIFTEFFFLDYDDGHHRYGFYQRKDGYISFDTISIEQKDGSRNSYWPFNFHTWFCHDPLRSNIFPIGMDLIDDGHLETRCLLRLMLEKNLIKMEWLDDYEENRSYYELIPYEAIDFQINEKPLDHIPDPFNVIENHEIEKLYKSILTACENLIKLYETNPEMF